LRRAAPRRRRPPPPLEVPNAKTPGLKTRFERALIGRGVTKFDVNCSSARTHTHRGRGLALAQAYFVTSTAPHSLFVALALALIAEQRQVGSMRHTMRPSTSVPYQPSCTEPHRLRSCSSRGTRMRGD
jgi:hypothetical protein